MEQKKKGFIGGIAGLVAGEMQTPVEDRVLAADPDELRRALAPHNGNLLYPEGPDDPLDIENFRGKFEASMRRRDAAAARSGTADTYTESDTPMSEQTKIELRAIGYDC